MMTEVFEGRGAEHGGIYVSVSHLPEQIIDNYPAAKNVPYLSKDWDFMTAMPYEHLRLISECTGDVRDLTLCTGAKLLEDFKGRNLIAFGGEWSVGFLLKHNPGLVLSDSLSV